MAVTHAWAQALRAIKLTANSKIKDGDKLRVSYYTSGAPMLDKRQPVLCMSEPKTIELWKGIVTKVNEILHPKVWMLDMDEIRGGGTCALCANRKNADGSKMTPPQILGACVTKQVQMIRELNHDAEVAIWNDMFDPKANAQKHYYTVPGGYEGSWNYMPPKMIVVAWRCWNSGRRKHRPFLRSSATASSAGAYYDADDLEGCKQWLKSLAKSPSSAGIMYTTWEVKVLAIGGVRGFGEQAMTNSMPKAQPIAIQSLLTLCLVFSLCRYRTRLLHSFAYLQDRSKHGFERRR